MTSELFHKSFRFAIDRGGTFTDVYAECPYGKVRILKLLSEDPAYKDAPREGIRRILQEETGIKFPADEPIDPSYIEWIRMGTTVATNALLERKGERMALAVTKGFRDLLHIGNQTRPKIFDLKVLCPEVLYEEVIEVDERVIPVQEDSMLKKDHKIIVKATTGEHSKLELWQKLNKEALKKDLKRVLDKGIKSLAVVLMHSYIYESHEKEVGELAKEMGFEQVSLSSVVMPMMRITPRGYTACADAYLTPCIQRYVSGFASGFKDGVKNLNVLFMQSDGGLTPVSRFCGSKAILSGPAGGVVGYAMTTYGRETNKPVIGFDMGGTSTDVSRYCGQYEHVFESTTAGITIQAPQLDINTVAAGGGSRLFFRSGKPVVGPESAGAHPGPVCYRKGGHLAVTDSNLVLGRLLPEYFPKIFGPSEDQPLDKEGSIEAFTKFTQQVNNYIATQPGGQHQTPYTVEELALGFIKVANESMCRPIRNLTQARGHDTAQHVLACFGGAGGQHACAIARSLGMSTVFIHRYAGILSAYGIALADIVHEAQEPCSHVYEKESFPYLDERIDLLIDKCTEELKKEGLDKGCIFTEVFLNMRYDKTDCALMCNPSKVITNSSRHGDFEQSFLERYRREFGFVIPGRKIYVEDIRVRGIGASKVDLKGVVSSASGPPKPKKVTDCYFEEGLLKTSVFFLEEIASGYDIQGPAIIIDKTSTIVVEPDCTAVVTVNGDVRIEIGAHKDKSMVGTELDRIQLAIFSHRFMSTAEQMGRVLQRTSISTNIKERLDFSCAMFGPDGGLVANAPHIPVHLGSMQETVQYQIRSLGDDLKEGDVILTNHPVAGGTHLPDLTVITPVFYPGQPRPVFYVASRGHHADIGGKAPGSMPPNSKSIFEEGAVFKSFKLVSNGHFQEEALTEKLMEPGKYPGCSGTRNLEDNISDLRAQVAANHKGISLIKELIDEYKLDVVQAYMTHIQQNAEDAVRQMLQVVGKKFKEETGQTRFSAREHMDDGTPIQLTVSIDVDTGSAVFDFEGTGPEMYGNCNAPKAIAFSAIIYCLRCMVDQDIPLNQGCLNPVTVKIPKSSLLSPSENAAVVGGNVLTCQRIVDVVLKAFKVCAASQIEIQEQIAKVEPFITPGQDSIWGLPSGNAVVKTSLNKLRPCDETTDEVPGYCIRFCYQVGIIEESDNSSPWIEVQSRGKHGLTTIQETKKEFEQKLNELKHRFEFVKQRVPELETAVAEERHAHEQTKERLKESNEKINELDIILVSIQKALEEKEKEVIEIKQVLAAFEKKLQEEQKAKEQAEKKLQSYEEKTTQLETSLANAQKLLKRKLEPQNERKWILDREEIHLADEKLGSGTFGTVYKGMFRGTQVAVKQFKPRITEYNREKFRREMEMASQCRHPCMLQFIGATSDDESPLLVTELLDTSLKAVLLDRALDPMEFKTIAEDVAKGLNYLHLNRPYPIVHRDISSGNVLLWQDGQSLRGKISDYGNAVLMNYARTGSGGALPYLAPEMTNQRFSTKGDVYSYGVLLLEMCHRREPSCSDNREELICLLEDYGWRNLVRRCLQQDPKQRPSMEAILSALKTNSGQATMK